MRRTGSATIGFTGLICLLAGLAGADLARSAAKGKPLLPADIVGGWRTQGVGYAQIDFDADGTFRSFLHERPWEEGRWELRGTTLVINGNHSKDRLTDVKRQGKQLTGKIGKMRVRWTRI